MTDVDQRSVTAKEIGLHHKSGPYTIHTREAEKKGVINRRDRRYHHPYNSTHYNVPKPDQIGSDLAVCALIKNVRTCANTRAHLERKQQSCVIG